jgi:hypothetical protein
LVERETLYNLNKKYGIYTGPKSKAAIAYVDAAAERENENEQFDGPEFQTLGEYETDAERNL